MTGVLGLFGYLGTSPAVGPTIWPELRDRLLTIAATDGGRDKAYMIVTLIPWAIRRAPVSMRQGDIIIFSVINDCDDRMPSRATCVLTGRRASPMSSTICLKGT